MQQHQVPSGLARAAICSTHARQAAHRYFCRILDRHRSASNPSLLGPYQLLQSGQKTPTRKEGYIIQKLERQASSGIELATLGENPVGEHSANQGSSQRVLYRTAAVDGLKIFLSRGGSIERPYYRAAARNSHGRPTCSAS